MSIDGLAKRYFTQWFDRHVPGWTERFDPTPTREHKDLLQKAEKNGRDIEVLLMAQFFRAEVHEDAIFDAIASVLAADQQVMLKLTLPEEDDLYADLVAHPNVLRVAALSGGYTRDEATERLARNHGVIASFSRALPQGLPAPQGQAAFDAARLHGHLLLHPRPAHRRARRHWPHDRGDK